MLDPVRVSFAFATQAAAPLAAACAAQAFVMLAADLALVLPAVAAQAAAARKGVATAAGVFGL